MKLVREHVNEKFKEKSDPIEDLGVGACEQRIQKTANYLNDLWTKYYDKIREDEDDEEAWHIIDIIQNIKDILKIQYFS